MKEKVLIVDDERSIREALAKALRCAGYEPLMAIDGNQAIKIFAEHQPDLVVLDLNMPAQNGWDTFEAITTQRPLTPVIIITGRPGQLEIATAARVGALLEKPLDVPVLMEIVRVLICEPVSERVSRLAHGVPNTIYCGSDPDENRGAEELSVLALRQLHLIRKRQLDDLRSYGEN